MPTLSKRVAAIMLLSVLLAVIAGCFVPGELEDEQEQYCNNVRDGVWPDFDSGRFKKECGGKDPPKFDADLTKY